MASTPKSNVEKLRRALDGWEQIAPTKTFAGMTLAQFKAAIAPSLDLRQEIEETNTRLKSLQAQRDQADDISLAKFQQVVNGILADPDFGPDSPLYEAFGYIRDSERHSGLTRKSTKETGKPDEK